jgi:hypothetical protein
MAHPEVLLTLNKIEDPVERFVAVVKFYLSGWHIKPPYVETLLCMPWSRADDSVGASRNR